MMRKLTFPAVLFVLAAFIISCTDESAPVLTVAAESDSEIARIEATNTLMPATATLTPAPTDPPTDVPISMTPTSTATSLRPTPTPPPTWALPTPFSVSSEYAGMRVQHEQNAYVVAPDGTLKPYRRGLLRWSSERWELAEMQYERPALDIPFRATDLETGVQATVIVPNVNHVSFVNFVSPHSDWILLAVAHGESYWDGPVPQSGVLNLRTGVYRELGGLASVNQATGQVAFVTTALSLENDAPSTALAIFDEATAKSELVRFADFGLAVTTPCLDAPQWDLVTGQLLVTGVNYGRDCAALNGLIYLDLSAQSGHIVPIRYAGPDGYLQPPIGFGGGWLWQGEINGDTGVWHFDHNGKVQAHFAGSLAPRALNDHVIAFHHEESGWQVVDLINGRAMSIEFKPEAVGDGVHVWGRSYIGTSGREVSWWFNTETFVVTRPDLPAGATFTGSSYQD